MRSGGLPLGVLLPSGRRRVGLALGAVLGLSTALTGCVRVYQPLSGLHRVVVVDPQARNFSDLGLSVHCLPGELLGPDEAGVLCDRVGTLFENQGARVSTTITGRPAEQPDLDLVAPAQLTLELRARQLHESRHPLSWLLCIGTFTLVPGVTESTFAQDVVIKDGSGFLLATESLQGRLVQRFGVGSWVGNLLLDWIWRDDADKLTGDVAQRDLSADLYRQLSQLVFNANLQRQVLREEAPVTPAGALSSNPEPVK